MPFNRSPRPEERGAAAKGSAADSHAARVFYSAAQSRAYTSPANAAIQRDLTRHALELLQLHDVHLDGDDGGRDGVRMLLDVGAGSGLSTAAACAWFSERKMHAVTLAFDISASMLSLAASEAAAGAEFYCGNAGQRFPLRRGVFDAAIGISMLQWLPPSGLEACFASLSELLSANGRSRVVFQVYPPSLEYVAVMERIARRAGFRRAETFVSFPHTTTAKKWFFSVDRESPAPVHASTLKKQEVCVFGRRFHRRCVLQWLDETPERHRSMTTSMINIRARVEREHVKEAWRVLRKYRLAGAALESGVQMNEQAKRSLELFESDKHIGQAIEDHFKSVDDVNYAVLLENAHAVVAIVHAVCAGLHAHRLCMGFVIHQDVSVLC
jgi:SAM-dependent methyltransferase